MYIQDALRSMTFGQAAKRPCWTGFIAKDEIPCVNPDNDDAGVSREKFVFYGRDGKVIASFGGEGDGSSVQLDDSLFSSILADDWIVGLKEDFMSAITSKGRF